MPVITIRGNLGSGTPEIGTLVARKLHGDYVDREIITMVAELLNHREQDVTAKEMPNDGFLGRIANALGRTPLLRSDFGADYRGVDLPAPKEQLDDTRYLEGLNSIIRELAMSESIVIRGRGSQFILRNWPGAIHVLCVAPLKLRVRRVALDMNIDEDSAKTEISRFDSSRSQFINRYFKAGVDDPEYYDLVINTEHLTFDAAASIIVNALPLKG